MLAKKAHFGENELNTDDPVDDRSLCVGNYDKWFKFGQFAVRSATCSITCITITIMKC